ncbi:helix-turn-helix transcriptional regulator [Virgisporangium ochraceum]|uniref:helix-turn-helix transcriptional regulator n=1 Tax=Virgisporangium ochraceum TaxID=65505 RepID=UPI001944AE12|nr:YafY family protein [Virgisporangium ochraceum]
MLKNPSRLLRLLTLLQARRDWTGPELAERLEVSTRTVRRDIDKLRSLDYPVHAGTGPGARYRLGPGAALPPLLLDDDEAVAVAVALHTAAGSGVADIGDTALGALIKVEQVLPSRLRHRVGALRIATVPSAQGGSPVDVDLLTAVASACRDRQQLRFAYRSYDGGGSERRTEPHRLVSWGRRWYLVAWDLDRADWRSFRLDRIGPRPQTGPRFAAREPPGGDAAAFVSRGVADVWESQARIRLHAPADAVRDRLWPLHGRLVPIDGHSCMLHLGADSPQILAYLLVVLGVDFTVESPPGFAAHLRAVAGRLTAAADATERFQATP